MESKSKNLDMLDSGKKLNQKIRYGAICRKSVIVGFVIKNRRFGVCDAGDVVGYWLCKGYRRLYFVTRD